MRFIALAMIVLLSSAGFLGCAPKAQNDCGFVQNVYGERISWKGQLPVVMKLHQSFPLAYESALRSAMETWNRRAGETLFVLDSKNIVNTAAVARDRSNVVSFSSTWESDKLSEQARTSVHWVGDQIQEADIKINASPRPNSTAQLFNFYWGDRVEPAINIEALFLHELGHVLGLRHKDQGHSVMATYLANNDDRIDLASTDESSLRCEYN